MSAGSHLYQVLKYANKTDIPCSRGLAKQLRKHGKASRPSAPAAFAALKPSLYPELPRQSAYRERRAVSHIWLLLSSRYEEERLKARRERSVQSGPVRVGGGWRRAGLACGSSQGLWLSRDRCHTRGPALLLRTWSQTQVQIQFSPLSHRRTLGKLKVHNDLGGYCEKSGTV